MRSLVSHLRTIILPAQATVLMQFGLFCVFYASDRIPGIRIQADVLSFLAIATMMSAAGDCAK